MCEHLQGNIGHKLFFNNWFTTTDLLIYLKEIGVLAVGTVRANRLEGWPLEQNKAIEKQDRGSMDYGVDLNTGLFMVRWMDNSIVQLASNFVGIESMGTLNRWDSHCVKSVQIRSFFWSVFSYIQKKLRIRTLFTQRVMAEKRKILHVRKLSHNKSMGGVDLTDRFIALYRIQYKTMCWWFKAFWHMVDVAKVKVPKCLDTKLKEEILHCVSENSLKCLKMFSLEIFNALIYAIMPASRDIPSKRKSSEADKPPPHSPVDDVWYDNIGHWPVLVSDEKTCRLCQSYTQKCTKNVKNVKWHYVCSKIAILL